MISVQRRGVLVAAGVLVVAAAIWLAAIMVAEPLNRTDFRYVWIAGAVWAEGGNPYSAAFIARSAAAFGEADKLSVWVYPFSWYLPSRMLALLPVETAFRVWQTLLLGCGAVCAWCAYRAAPVSSAARAPLIALLLLFYCCTNTAVSGLLRSGQPALVAITGLAILLYSARHPSRAATVLGLVLVSFKPQFGLIAFAAVASDRAGLLSEVFATLWIGALSVFVLLSTSFGAQLSALLHSLAGGYQSLVVNDPSHLIALPQFVFALSGARVPLGITTLAATALVFAICLWTRHFSRRSNDAGLLCMTVAILAICFLVGVHGSDLAALILLLPLSLTLAGPARWLAAAGYLLLWRPENVSRAAALPGLIGVSTVAVTLICLAFLLAATMWLRKYRYADDEDNVHPDRSTLVRNVVE